MTPFMAQRPKADPLAGLDDLIDILSWQRPAGGHGEAHIIKKYILPTGATDDGFGNFMLRIGTAPVLWSCHTDTVHRKDFGRQKLEVDTLGILSTSDGSCLGADCGAGMWLMLQMIKAQKEGLYIFHREEEIGGNGSSYIARKTPHVLDGIQFAIAFDRFGTDSIITHQGGRCCSEVFSKSLSSALWRASKMVFQSDDGGTFTDTANYTELVPECTNLSVGYYNQHSKNEYQDTTHLKALLSALLNLDLSALKVSRKVTDFDDPWTSQGEGWTDNLHDPESEYGILSGLLYRDPDLAAVYLARAGITSYELERGLQELSLEFSFN